MQRRRLTQPPYRMGPFQQALDHSLKTYFIKGLYLESFYKVWSLAKVPVYPLNINKPIREDFRYQSSLPAQLSQNITEFIAVFLIVGIINT